MKLSIIILNYNTPKLIKYLLKNILSLKLPFEYEIIVVDNGANKQLKDELKSYSPYLKMFAIANQGYAHGNNFGISKASGQYILILNPDIYIRPKSIERLVEFMEKNKRAGMVGPKLLYPNGEYQYSCTRYPDWRLPFYRRSRLGRTKAGQQWLKKYLYMDYDHESPKQVDWLFGACFLIRKSAIDEVGLLDQRYFLYFEDLDWCRRFWQKNWPVWYYPQAQVIHFHHRDSADKSGLKGIFSKLGRIHLISWFKYMWKWRKVKS